MALGYIGEGMNVICNYTKQVTSDNEHANSLASDEYLYPDYII